MPYCCTIAEINASESGSSSKYREGKPYWSSPKPRLIVIALGRGVCSAAPSSAPKMSLSEGVNDAGTTSR